MSLVRKGVKEGILKYQGQIGKIPWPEKMDTFTFSSVFLLVSPRNLAGPPTYKLVL